MDEFKLIELVQQNEFLYDKSIEAYRDVIQKNNAWDSIARVLGVSGNTIWSFNKIFLTNYKFTRMHSIIIISLMAKI